MLGAHILVGHIQRDTGIYSVWGKLLCTPFLCSNRHLDTCITNELSANQIVHNNGDRYLHKSPDYLDVQDRKLIIFGANPVRIEDYSFIYNCHHALI